MGYIIKTTGITANALVSVHKRKAAHQLRWLGYDVLQSYALLDTKAGHAAHQRIEAVARDVEAGKYARHSTTSIPMPYGVPAIHIERN